MSTWRYSSSTASSSARSSVPISRGNLGGATAALSIAKLEGRTIAPGATLSDARKAMKRDRRRRLAVTNTEGRLLGLLCLKASGLGFCSDADVTSRTDPA